MKTVAEVIGVSRSNLTEQADNTAKPMLDGGYHEVPHIVGGDAACGGEEAAYRTPSASAALHQGQNDQERITSDG
jgi:hypothetical protein